MCPSVHRSVPLSPRKAGGHVQGESEGAPLGSEMAFQCQEHADVHLLSQMFSLRFVIQIVNENVFDASNIDPTSPFWNLAFFQPGHRWLCDPI